ncbi:MAG: hypothetical protein II822_08770, partial [Prevotella sp.]|nr:hypothetical protein [Prevotella sp.]
FHFSLLLFNFDTAKVSRKSIKSLPLAVFFIFPHLQDVNQAFPLQPDIGQHLDKEQITKDLDFCLA